MRSHRRGTRATGNRRKLVWATVEQATSALAAGASANIGLLGDLGNATLGCTIMRTHVRVTPTAAVALADSVNLGLIVARNTDVADPTTAGLVTVAQADLDWMFIHRWTANPTLFEGGSNSISIDVRSKRKLQELNQNYILSIKNNQSAASTYRVYARTLIALP